uniref:Uncharacterized AAA domain-containing protein ycf46 n=1 Tax=Helminthora furcellata TaxID=1884666 RepID=A0A1G4NZ25_9FLOR|nr:Hypothetical protein ycf46 [Helminthora furcellata]SCW21073.1 Hypothetical protein ycf46 [Helminthora furcellata]SCW23933.1 Hypothetical protein ycf46 [Helminthora furcellata]
MQFKAELELLITSSCSLIYVLTHEEERLQSMIEDITADDSRQALYTWNFIEGFEVDNSVYENTQKNPSQALDFIESFNVNSDALFLLKDFNPFLSDISITRKIRNLSRKLDSCNHIIIITGTDPLIPEQLKYLIEFLVLPLPNKYEIQLELNRLLKLLSIPTFENQIDIISSICQGLSINQIRKVTSKILVNTSDLANTYPIEFLREKQKYVSQTSLLEIHQSEVLLDDIGGIDHLKDWLLTRSNAFSELSINYGLPYPKGLLLLGVQGTGKSITAKAIANAWSLALLRLDIGRLFAGVVGQSEANTREMIQVVEASAPCILWIDEIDKAFDKSLPGGDSGTSNRVLATLLTWLSDKTTPVFIVATANTISNLPSEIIRKGRFDEIFFLDLPSVTEREKIFQVHLKKTRPETWHRYNINYLAKYSILFSGAEIKQVIVEAMYLAFMQKRDFTSLDILNAIDNIIPLAFTDNYNIQKIQALASSGKFRLASSS